MIAYTYEIAPWCPTNEFDPEPIVQIAGPDRDGIIADDLAIGFAVAEHLPIDPDTWSRIPNDHATAAWADIDNADNTVTVAAFNITGPRGTYQTRITRPAS